jgi:RNA polymerase sigma factor (TIGR02999 family)
VHEAYLRLVDAAKAEHWDSRGHFFAAAAESMRRILVDNARRKRSLKHGGGRLHRPLDEGALIDPEPSEDILALSDALDRLAAADGQAAELVKLRYFAGLTSQQAAHILGVSARTADRIWVYARSFLLREIEKA